MLNRRQLIVAGAALLPACRTEGVQARRAAMLDEAAVHRLRARVPDYSSLFTLSELRQRQRRTRMDHPDLVRVQSIGVSKQGQPIELISVGSGRNSALVVAGLHPNEPLGSLTTDFLMGVLIDDRRLRESLDFTWHFVNPIDPDGMQLNERWFKSQLTPEAYFAGFFRPALDRQAEYTFPLQVGSVAFDAGPPENMAWRRALELTKPRLQYTLHNAEYGGAFFLTSRSFPQFEQRLQSLPGAFGIPLNPVGEPLADLPVRAQGIFGLPMPAELLGRAAAQLKSADAATLRSFWPAGDSSTAYASRFGTFSVSAEVPYWNDPRVFDDSLSDWTLPRIINEYVARSEQGASLLDRCSAALSAVDLTKFGFELVYSLREHLSSWRRRVARLRAALDADAIDGRRLSTRDATIYRVSMQLTIVRPYAAIVRLAGNGDGPRILPESYGNEAQAIINRLLGEIRAEAELSDVPLRSSVGLQAAVGLLAAGLLTASH